MSMRTTLTLLAGAAVAAALGYIDQTCPGFNWGKLGMVVATAVWGAWNLHRPAPPVKWDGTERRER